MVKGSLAAFVLQHTKEAYVKVSIIQFYSFRLTSNGGKFIQETINLTPVIIKSSRRKSND